MHTIHELSLVFFGGVPQSILYDNDKCLVSRILSDGTRQRTRAFSGLQSHYLFEDRYGRPGKGNDKGNVEGVVGYARRNFMTPLPRFASWDAFNGHLEEQCRNRQGNVLRGHRESIGERFVRDREALKRPLPAPFDACDKQGTRVNSLSLVRYRTNDYSVPVAYGHQEVWIRGYVHEVVIGCGGGIIARHPRSYDREDMVFDPIHYLALLEHKIGALDQAAPLAGWELPDAFPTLRRLLEARMGKAGKREYVQVLRLVETFDLEVLHGAVKDALRLGAIGYDAVKHLVLCRIERRPPKLDLDIYPYLPRANVATTAAASYMSRHSPDDIQIRGRRTTDPPPWELRTLRSPPMRRLWRADQVRNAIWQSIPPSRRTSPIVFTSPLISSAYAGTGLGRRSSIKLKIFWNKLLGTATSANWNVTYRP